MDKKRKMEYLYEPNCLLGTFLPNSQPLSLQTKQIDLFLPYTQHAQNNKQIFLDIANFAFRNTEELEFIIIIIVIFKTSISQLNGISYMNLISPLHTG